MHPDANVGGTETALERRWDGESAERIAEALRRSWEAYPHRNRYRVLSGPNSNTYVAWVLREAGIAHRLSWRGLGRNFVRTF